MDRAEHIVQLYLAERFATVIHEPDGNVPPDFLVDGRIAVEVRRLNQNENSEGRLRGLEESSIPLFMKMRALLSKLSLPMGGPGMWVSFSYSRPLPPWDEIRPWVVKTLQSITPSEFSKAHEARLGGLTLKIPALAESHPGRFVLTGYIDHDAGGWMLAELKRNIEICVTEKTLKIQKVKPRYPEWWLVLVDYIGFGLNDEDLQLFADNIRIEHSWDKLLLIDPKGNGRAMEV